VLNQAAQTAKRSPDFAAIVKRRGKKIAPFEEPELYAEELRAFFRPYRAATD
jgi:hypothetical protein